MTSAPTWAQRAVPAERTAVRMPSQPSSMRGWQRRNNLLVSRTGVAWRVAQLQTRTAAPAKRRPLKSFDAAIRVWGWWDQLRLGVELLALQTVVGWRQTCPRMLRESMGDRPSSRRGG